MTDAPTIPDFIAALSRRLGADADGLGNVSALLTMATELPEMPASEKCDENRFHGCQSQIWLVMHTDPERETVCIRADSDSRIVRGLLAIAVGMYSGRQPEEISDHPPELLRKAGLIDALTPSRSNGFHRLMTHIYEQGCQMSACQRDDVA